MRTIFIVLGSALIIGFVTVVVFLRLGPVPAGSAEIPIPDVSGKAEESETYSGSPRSGGTQPGSDTPQKGSMTVKAAGGGTITVKDFLNDDSMTGEYPENENYYYLGNRVPSAEATGTPAIPSYHILYMSETQFFNISLLKEPIGKVRKEAEQYLMEHLGILEEEMCALDYMMSVPWRVNGTYSSMSLGFSFCPGAVPLPER